MKYSLMKKKYLPISIDITNQKVLIIGGGKSAFKKIKILQNFDVEVEVLALEILDEIKKSGIKFKQKKYEKEDIRGYLMLYSCSNDLELDKQIVQDATSMGVLANIHDKPGLCQFISPAIYKEGNLTVAVGSNGEDVFKSIRTRDLIAQFLKENPIDNIIKTI